MTSSEGVLFSRSTPADLTACDREPIHVPGSIQPHGFLLALGESDGRIHYCSDNAFEFFGREPAGILGGHVAEIVGDELAARIVQAARDPLFSRRAIFIDRIHDSVTPYALVGHRRQDHLILEGERLLTDPPPVSDTHYQLEAFLSQMEAAGTVPDLVQLAAQETRRLTGFDRVLVYQFDADWNGIVIAEDRNEVLPSYLDLRFPASDIPRQARELYRLNRLRLIADAGYRPVPLRGLSTRGSKPLDLSLSTLRSVSPVHLEYMRNMGTGSSMSISLVRGGALWGLISCHSREPRVVPFENRATCDLLGQVLSLQIAAREQASALSYRMRLQSVLSPLLATVAQHDRFIDGLGANTQALLGIVAADGAAVVADGEVALYGHTPPALEVQALAAWLDARGDDDLFATAELPAVYAPAAAFAATGSGLLALSISRQRRSRLLWFRRELVETVRWGGDPRKPVSADPADALRLHPRKSFATWQQTVRGRAAPWQPPEIETARTFRSAVVDIVLSGAEKLAEITEDLSRTNKELENFSYTVSHDLRAPFRHIRGYAELLKAEKGSQLDAEGREFIEHVLSGATYAGRLVDNILAFSQMGRTELMLTEVALEDLAWRVMDDFRLLTSSRRIEWDIDPLPTVEADAAMIRTVLQNLFENAVKYTRDRPVARIAVGTQADPKEHIVFVRDNGVGFDEKYKAKLFGMFQRLHRWEEFEGTGIGLASVRRIIARHGGRVWAQGRPGEGATFTFTLPKTPVRSNPLYA